MAFTQRNDCGHNAYSFDYDECTVCAAQAAQLEESPQPSVQVVYDALPPLNPQQSEALHDASEAAHRVIMAIHALFVLGHTQRNRSALEWAVANFQAAGIPVTKTLNLSQERIALMTAAGTKDSTKR